MNRTVISDFRQWKLTALLMFGLLVYLLTSYDVFHKRYTPHHSNTRRELFLKQDDPSLIQLVRERYILPPNSAPYMLKTGDLKPDQSNGQVDALRAYFKDKGNGFFIECGAYDGEFLSNTLWFEKVLGWTGLLIEADPTNFRELRKKNRQAWHANVCLSPTQFPGKLNFFVNPQGDGTLSGLRSRYAVNHSIPIDCIPLYTLLAAINQFTVDIFSLDIEGLELQVLKTIPFDKVIFKFIIIENWETEPVMAFMNGAGFKLFAHIYDGHSNDLIFAHSSVLASDFVEILPLTSCAHDQPGAHCTERST